MRRPQHPTYTGLVYDYLVALDDFASMKMIKEATRLDLHQIRTTLLSLKGYRAVDSTDVQGVLWWCATPKTDTRIRTTKEIAIHTRRAKRKPATKKEPA